jgi:mycothiol system anti-sigma-R factor
MKELCRETLQRAYLFMDGEVLSATERKQIQVHLEECAPCLARYGLEREVVMLMGRLKGTTHCPEVLRNRITSLLDQA